MFMSRYNHTIDAKGRLIIPSKFRDRLGDEFVVTRGIESCLFVFPNDDWQVFEQKLVSLPTTDAEARKFVRFMLGNATSVEVDKQGRILIPAELRTYAGLDKEVTLVGMGQKIEIWDKDKLNDFESEENMGQITQGLNDRGITI